MTEEGDGTLSVPLHPVAVFQGDRFPTQISNAGTGNVLLRRTNRRNGGAAKYQNQASEMGTLATARVPGQRGGASVLWHAADFVGGGRRVQRCRTLLAGDGSFVTSKSPVEKGGDPRTVANDHMIADLITTDAVNLPKLVDRIGAPLSPYAVTKYVDELYADVFARTYGVTHVSLRYFIVFGPRQDPEGAYAAVIPKWIAAMIEGRPVHVYGNGSTSRDFC